MNFRLIEKKVITWFMLLLAVIYLFLITIGQLTEATRAEFNTQEKVIGSIAVADDDSEKSDNEDTEASEENNDNEDTEASEENNDNEDTEASEENNDNEDTEASEENNDNEDTEASEENNDNEDTEASKENNDNHSQ